MDEAIQKAHRIAAEYVSLAPDRDFTNHYDVLVQLVSTAYSHGVRDGYQECMEDAKRVVDGAA